MSKQVIQTDQAPAAIGTYSQAISTTATRTIYLSGQIPLDPISMTLVSEDFVEQAHQVFKNLSAVAHAAGCELDECVKLTVYLTDLTQFQRANEVMAQYFNEPYPARAAVQVSALPKDAQIEIDAVIASTNSE